MPAACAVIGCKSHGNMPQRKFFRFPMLNNVSAKTLAVTQARQHAWLAALNRSNFFPDQYQHARVCDLHFISGKSARFNDVNNQDWIPSKNLGYEVKKQPNEVFDQSNGQPKEELIDESNRHLHEGLDNQSSVLLNEELNDQSNRHSHEELDNQSSVFLNEELNDQSNGPATASKQTQTDFAKASIGTQTDDTLTGMSSEILLTYEEKIQLLEEMLSSHNVAMESFRGQDEKTNFFTGISHFATLEALFELFEPDIPISMKLTKFQIMFIVLTRLRLNLSFKYLSYQFNVSVPTVSKHFHKCLSVLHKKLKHFVYWPERAAIKKTMPLSFQKQFANKIVAIIDCFDIFIEKPSNVKAAAQCFSFYKHAFTIKYLIGITPQGFIAFISKGYGGRASDKFITENCDFLNKLETGDTVMADRGFLIEEELANRGVELSIPAFTKGKTQLHAIEIEDTRNIANVRIHVERIIGQLRQKYTILHQFKFPMSLIVKEKSSSVNAIDQIVTVCCALSNLCSPIVCKKSDDTL